MKMKFRLMKDIAGYCIVCETKQYLYKYCENRNNCYFTACDDKNVAYWQIEKNAKEYLNEIMNDEINIMWMGE